MAKITVPLLPQATTEYNQSQFAQLILSLDQLIFALNNTYTPESLRDDDEAYSFFMGDSPSTQETDTSSIESDVSTNTSNISTNSSNITTNTNNISTANTNITTLQSQVGALQKQVRYLIAVK